MPNNSKTQLKTIVDFARRKGFVFPSSEIYGGFAATYDFGPLGVLLKKNIEQVWRNWNVTSRTDMVEIEGAIFMHPKVWEASGHIGGFADLLVEDTVTHKRYRADHLVEDAKVVWPVGETKNSPLEGWWQTQINEVFTESIEETLTIGQRKDNIDDYRENVRVLLYNPKTDKYAIQYVEKYKEYNLLGGGIEKGHTPLDTAKKEVLEETGYTDFTIITQLGGKIDCFYEEDGRSCERLSTGFLAILNSEENSGTKMEDYEIEEGCKCVWKAKKEVLEIFNEQSKIYLTYLYHLEVLNRGLRYLENTNFKNNKAYIVEKSLSSDKFEQLKEFGTVEIDKTIEDWGKLVYLYYQPETENKLVEFLKSNLLAKSENNSTSWYCEVGSKVVFANKIIDIAENGGFESFQNYGRSLGIPEEQLDAVSAREFIKNSNSKPQIITNAGSFSAEEIDQIIEHYKLKSPEGNPLTKAKKFNLLVPTHLGGAVQDESSIAYLKGESCANIYVDWKAIQETTRRKLPFGIAQIGKAFRNEITVKQFMFRTREFEQMDVEFFVKPGTEDKFYSEWKQNRWDFYTKILNFNETNLQYRQHDKDELVFYAKEAWDVEYNFGEIGFKELEGIHNRTDYDTTQHSKFSGQDLTYFDSDTNTRYNPYIVEMSAGFNRMYLAVMFEFYTEEILTTEKGEQETRVVFKLPYSLAPYKLAVLPLMKKDGLGEFAFDLYSKLRKQGISADYDEAGSIGKRYRRQDENGTPWCLCVDYDTLKEGETKNTVTLRHRNTMEQVRVAIEDLETFIKGF
jgi:glycyl-tRNA synthetase